MNTPVPAKRKVKALVVLSGGQDSTTCAFWASQYYDEVHCITFNYDQRHSREILAAKDVAKLVGATSHEIIHVGPILKSTSPLTSATAELEQYENFEQMDKVIGDRIEKTFVPMRNALFLTIAANRAMCLAEDGSMVAIITGVCQADNANYPDCRELFIHDQTNAINSALGYDVTDTRYTHIITPLMNMSKDESIKLAMSFNSDAFASLAFSHTAYDGSYPPVGKDHATVLRAHGFEQAGVPDPLIIRAWAEGLMELPVTANYNNEVFNAGLVEHINRLKTTLGYF